MPKSTTPLYVQTIETPIGPIRIGTHAAGLARVLLPNRKMKCSWKTQPPAKLRVRI